MDEKQLQLLWDSHAKNGGFGSFNEFKNLMSDNNARKVYFDNANPDLGFANYQEFEDVLGVKKKVSPLSPGQAGPEPSEVTLAPTSENLAKPVFQQPTESIQPELSITEPGAIEPTPEINPAVANAHEVSRRGKELKQTIKQKNEQIAKSVNDFATKRVAELQLMVKKPEDVLLLNDQLQAEILDYQRQEADKANADIKKVYDYFQEAANSEFSDPEFAKGFQETYKPIKDRKGGWNLVDSKTGRSLADKFWSAITDQMPGGIASAMAGSMSTNYDYELMKKKGWGHLYADSPKLVEEVRNKYIEQVGEEQYKKESEAYQKEQSQTKESILDYATRQKGQGEGKLYKYPKTWEEAVKSGRLGEYVAGNIGQVGGLAVPTIGASLVNPILGGAVGFGINSAMEKGEAFDEGLRIMESYGISRKDVLNKDLDALLRDTSTRSGLANGLMEYIGTVSAVGKLLPKNFVTELLGKISKSDMVSIPFGALMEGVTELMQAKDTHYAAMVGAGKSPEEALQYALAQDDSEEFIAGLIGGGGLSVLSNMVAGPNGQSGEAPTVKATEIKSKVEPEINTNEKPKESTVKVSGEGVQANPEDVKQEETLPVQAPEEKQGESITITPKENEQGTTTEPVPPATEQGDTRSVQEASEDVVRRISESSKNSEKPEEVDVRDEENKELEKYATEAGILQDGNNYGESHVKTGRESDIYFNEEKGTVTKINHLTLHGTFNEFLKRVKLQNRLFPNEALTLTGYTKKNDRLVPILEQPLVKADLKNPLTEEERVEELAKRGFKPVRENVFYNPELDITLKDATADNVVRDINGHVRFIDPILSEGNPFESEQEREAFDKQDVVDQEEAVEPEPTKGKDIYTHPFEEPEANEFISTLKKARSLNYKSDKVAWQAVMSGEVDVENLMTGKYPNKKKIDREEVISRIKANNQVLSEFINKSEKPELKSPREIANDKINALVESGDAKREGNRVTTITEKGGIELKAISEELKAALAKEKEVTESPVTIKDIAKAAPDKVIIASVPKPEKTEPEVKYFGRDNRFKAIGVNTDGEVIGEDANGVRARLRGNVVVTHPVGIIPGRGISVSSPSEEFLTVDETQEEAKSKAVEPKKSEAKFEKARKSAADLLDLIGPGLKINEEYDSEKNQKIIIKAGEVVANYIDAGVTRFAEMVQDIYETYGEKALRALFEPMKKGYGSVLASAEDIESMDDIKTVRAAKIEDFTTKKVDQDDQFVNELSGLIGKEKLDKRRIESIGEKYGITDKNKVKELAELAVVKKARELAHNDDFEGLVKLYNDQPNLTHRTNESIEKQQYSTPAPIAYLIGKYVGADKPGTKFEPSAGNGMLTIAGDPEAFVVNEIDDVRRANLKKQGFDVMAQDGSQDFNTPKEYDAVLTNPPFGGTEEVRIDGYKLTELAQIMSIRALDTMKDDGKAAIIIGGNNSFDSEGRLKGRDRIYFNYLFNKYNVEDVIDINGDIYRKQGASFPIRVILINGRKAAPEGVAPTKEWFGKQEKDFTGIQERIKQTGYENIQSTELGGKRESGPLSGSTIRSNESKKGSTSNVSGEKVSKPGEPVQSGRKPTDSGRVTSPSTVKGGDTTGNTNKPPVSTTPIEQGLETSRDESQPEGTPADVRGQQPKRNRTRTVGSSTGELTAPYKPSSTGTPFNVSSPASLQQEIEDAKRDLEGDVGNVDEFVKNKLGYKSIEEMHKGLSAEQIDGVALAIRNIERGTGIIIGDQPGIGKGRQAAAIIRYANMQGKKPIFLTKSAYLFSALYDDLNGIGYSNPKPFIVNGTDNIVDGEGKVLWRASSLKIKDREIPSDAKVILATYSQFQNIKQSVDKINLLIKMAKDNIIIMDESHMASGDESNTSALFQQILPTTKGVVYLSGTYAKRASSMPVYATKTSMKEANIAPGELIDAITKGGNPLQEITASNLTEAGEMIRRERPFKGIEIATHVIGGDNEQVGNKQREQADAVTGIMRELIDFQTTHINPAVKNMDQQTKAALKITTRRGAQLGGVSNSPYFQKVFNVVNQLLYAIKAQDIADLVIAEAKAGRKPFIAIKGTMESMLNDMISRGELAVGDPIKADFSFVLQKGLEGLFRITTEDAQGNKTKGEIPVSSLSEEGQKEYRYLKSKIANLKTGLTLSPIDLIVENLEKAGLKVAEVTGRKMRVSHRDGGTYIDNNRKLKTNEAYRRYNNGEIDVLIVNRSGSTGASAQASPKFKDVRPRTMFVLENELDISELVQILFRINRSGQIHLPKYVLVSSSIPAEQRLAIMTSKKLKSLDANTTSNQKQSKGLIEVPDLLNKYGDIVVHEYLQDNPEIDAELGSPIDGSINDSGEFIPKEGSASKVTGKVAVLSSDKQKAFYDDVTKRYNKYIDFLNEAGMNDLVIENLPLNAKTIKKEATILGKGGRSKFGDDTFLEEVEVNVLKKPMTKSEIDFSMKELGGDRTEEFKESLKNYAEGLYAKTAAEVNEKFAKKLAALEKDTKLTPEEKELEKITLESDKQDFLNGKQAAAEGKIKYIDGLLNFFKPGRAVMIPVDYADMRNAGVREGIFMGFDIDVNDPKGFLPSNVTLKFAINDSRRTLTLPSSKDNLVNFIRESSYDLSSKFKEDTYNNWDNLKKPRDREKRYIVTGNILQGLGNPEYRKGNIIKYTTEDGFINTGVMLPITFEPSETSNTISVPAKKAVDIIKNFPVGGSIENIEGDVKIKKETPNKFSIRVPKPAQTGGKYFLDEDLNKIVIAGRWDSVGQNMEAFVDDSRLDEFLTTLGNKFGTSFNVKKPETDEPSGNQYKPSGTTTNVDDAKLRGPHKTDVKPFNMVDRIKETFKKYGITINEGSLRRKYDGVYKQITNGVRVQSMWDLFVASHEMVHALDNKYKIVENIRKNASQKLQAEFSHAYENLYPDPKKSATLSERINEGLAMVMEMYLMDPNQATNQYPEIVKHLFTDGGQFHKKEMTDFINDMDNIITDYQSLNPEDRINARIKWDGVNKSSGVSTQTKVLHALTNDLITANMVDNMMGGELRAKAITPNVTMLRNIAAIAGNWIQKPFGITEEPQTYIGNGNWGKKSGKYRVSDLISKLGGVDDIIKFSDWLVARRQYFDYIKLDSLAEEINQGNLKKQEEYDSLKLIVDRNKMPLDLVEAVYYKFESKYDEASKIYDSINNDLIDFMEATELISKDKADGFRQSSGYASFQRFVDDEQSNIESLTLSSGSKARLGQLKARSGSSLQILPPVYSQMVAINETLRKGQLNLVWKSWADAAKANPEVAQMFEPVVKQDIKNPNNFQVVYEKGVEKWYKLSDESRMFAQALSPDQINLLNAFLRGASRIFQASTTQFFAPFAAMNVTIDASTRFMQSKTGLIPFIHDIPTVGKAMSGLAHWMGIIDNKAPNEVEQYMALGGRKQTLAGTLELEPMGAIESILNKDWVHVAKSGFEKTIKIVELPVNFTEIIGRATEYKRALAKGYPTNVAMHMAANVGINFSNKGSLANNYVKSVSYMGAGIQAFSQFIKTAKENPRKTSAAIGIMATLASTGAIMVFSMGDDDEKIALSNQNPEELARFIFLPGSVFGMKSGLIKIRIPEQGGNVAAAAQLYWAHHFMDNKIAFSDIYRTQETILPSQLRFSQGLGLAGSYLPQAISPSLQTITNTRFYPHLSPIVPDWMKDLDEYAQYDKYTSRTAKAIGEITKDSYVEISPKKVDFFIRAQGGRSVSLIMGLTEAAIYGDPVKTYINIFEESDRFLFTGRVYNKFYEMRDEATQELKALTSKKNTYPVSDEILREAKARVALFNKVHEVLSTVGNAINQGSDVPMEQRRQLFEMLQTITKEELTNNP